MMKKGLLFLLLPVLGLLLSGCSLKSKPAALQVNSTPSASVFVDGKLLGKTPFATESLKAGEITVKLIPDSTEEALVSWEGKVKLMGGVLTLIEREFAVSDSGSSGQMLSLEKIKDKDSSLISIVSDPDGVLVSIDGETKGFSPLSLDNVSPGDHEIAFSKESYQQKSLKVKNVSGYRLIVDIKLGGSELPPAPTPTPTVSGPTAKASITAKPSDKISPVEKSYILIKENSLGFLRVRNGPSGAEIAQVKPIDPEKKYPLLEEKPGWYRIEYEEGKEGWVTADTTYTQKVTQ